MAERSQAFLKSLYLVYIRVKKIFEIAEKTMKNNLNLTLNKPPPPKKKKKKKEKEINNGQQSIHLNLPTPKIAIFSENPKNTEIRNVDSKKKKGHAYV